jgi:5-hydroxyisourate hydrolase-like protein (transthyretin family)
VKKTNWRSLYSAMLLVSVCAVAACRLHRVDLRAPGTMPPQLEVLVLDHEHGEPIPGALVSILTERADALATATTDLHGRAQLRISSTKPGKYVIAERDGFYISGARCTRAERYTLEMIVFRLFD